MERYARLVSVPQPAHLSVSAGLLQTIVPPPQAHDGLFVLHEPFFVVVAGEGNHVLLCRMSVSAPSRQTDVGCWSVVTTTVWWSELFLTIYTYEDLCIKKIGITTNHHFHSSTSIYIVVRHAHPAFITPHTGSGHEESKVFSPTIS